MIFNQLFGGRRGALAGGRDPPAGQPRQVRPPSLAITQVLMEMRAEMVRELTTHTICGGTLDATSFWGDVRVEPEIFIAVENPSLMSGTANTALVISDEALRALKAWRAE